MQPTLPTPVPSAQSRYRLTGRRFAVLASLVVVLVAAGLAWPAISSTQFVRQATTKQIETYSELYFADHRDIPSSLPVGSSLQVPFAVTNHEGRTITYYYQATVSRTGATDTKQTGSLTLEDGQTGFHNVTISATKAGQTITITINLIGRNQTIRYRTQS
ncbi:MAG TPA: DUF1616 domain-containing protein [Candidatus Saccharimonas sp.]|nr:DUF1616 domain-containing protein [Candidatus Saccharimonas sp.]